MWEIGGGARPPGRYIDYESLVKASFCFVVTHLIALPFTVISVDFETINGFRVTVIT